MMGHSKPSPHSTHCKPPVWEIGLHYVQKFSVMCFQPFNLSVLILPQPASSDNRQPGYPKLPIISGKKWEKYSGFLCKVEGIKQATYIRNKLSKESAIEWMCGVPRKPR